MVGRGSETSYRHVTPEKNAKRTLRLVHRIHRIEWKECATAEEAIELERVLLLEKRPPFNRAGVWQGNPWWLKIEAVGTNLNLELVREENGTGPHPSAFRYAYGSVVRCLYRVAWPCEPLSSYPYGLFDARVPLSLSLALPDAVETAEALRAYAVVVIASHCCQSSQKCLQRPQSHSRSIGRRKWSG